MKYYRFKGKIYTISEMIDQKILTSKRVVRVKKIKYNRQKFNKMDHIEQLEYEKKLKETKNQYELIANDNSYFIATKKEYNQSRLKII